MFPTDGHLRSPRRIVLSSGPLYYAKVALPAGLLEMMI